MWGLSMCTVALVHRGASCWFWPDKASPVGNSFHSRTTDWEWTTWTGSSSESGGVLRRWICEQVKVKMNNKGVKLLIVAHFTQRVTKMFQKFQIKRQKADMQTHTLASTTREAAALEEFPSHSCSLLGSLPGQLPPSDPWEFTNTEMLLVSAPSMFQATQVYTPEEDRFNTSKRWKSNFNQDGCDAAAQTDLRLMGRRVRSPTLRAPTCDASSSSCSGPPLIWLVQPPP